MSSVRKILTVPANGQISIGTQWAGREIRIESVSEGELRIVAGTFVESRNATFYTRDAQERLDAFNEWSEGNLSKKTDMKALRARRGKKKRT